MFARISLFSVSILSIISYYYGRRAPRLIWPRKTLGRPWSHRPFRARVRSTRRRCVTVTKYTCSCVPFASWQSSRKRLRRTLTKSKLPVPDDPTDSIALFRSPEPFCFKRLGTTSIPIQMENVCRTACEIDFVNDRFFFYFIFFNFPIPQSVRLNPYGLSVRRHCRC
jgi:hypothetical protein